MGTRIPIVETNFDTKLNNSNSGCQICSNQLKEKKKQQKMLITSILRLKKFVKNLKIQQNISSKNNGTKFAEIDGCSDVKSHLEECRKIVKNFESQTPLCVGQVAVL